VRELIEVQVKHSLTHDLNVSRGINLNALCASSALDTVDGNRITAPAAVVVFGMYRPCD